MARRSFTITPDLNLVDTIRGAKNPVMVGPTETWWSTRTPDGPGTLNIQRVSDVQIEAEAWGPGSGWLLHQVPGLLGQHDDLTRFEPSGFVLEQWRKRPFKLARTDRPWDAIVGGVFGQKVQVANAVKARRLLARNFGEPAPGPRQGWILPSPEDVGQMAYHDFHRFGVERKRAEILIRVAREMRRISFDDADPTKIQARLERIRGIGPWTSAMVTAVVYGDADAVPVGDFHIPNTVCWALAQEPRGTDERMLELLAPYGGHRWRVIRLAKSSGPAPKYGPKLSLTDDGMHKGR